MKDNSSLIKGIDWLSKNQLDTYWKTILSFMSIIKAEPNVLRQIKNYLLSFSSNLKKTFLKHLTDLNNKLNIYTQLIREYNFQNIMEENLIYMIYMKDGSYKSIINILIISENKDNQQNYFNC